MSRLLLDTGIAGMFERVRAERSKGNPVGIAVPVLAELAYGIEKSATRHRNMKLLHAALRTLRLWPFDRDAAFEYGRLHAELLRIGRPMQVLDIMIAAVALTLKNCTVVSKDSD